MALEVTLEVFEGPLDLLLALIDRNKIDIYDIPITIVTDQYLEYIRRMQQRDMDITSEFLVMAATLLSIKSKMLLPKAVNEDGEEEDPRQELVEQLLQYKMYKYMSYELKDMQRGADFRLYRSKNIPPEVEKYEEPVDLQELIGDRNLATLNEIFRQVLKRQQDKVDPIRSGFGKIEREEIDLDQKTLYIRAYIREHPSFSFRQLLERQHSNTEIIVTFLVVLEEMKLGEIEIEQADAFGEIKIRAKDVA